MEKNNIRHDEKRKRIRLFFICYFVGLIIICLFLAIHAKSENITKEYYTRPMESDDEDQDQNQNTSNYWEWADDTTLTFDLSTDHANTMAFALDGFDCGNLNFSDETVTFTMKDADKGNILQKSVYPLKYQQIDDKTLYFGFDNPLPAGEHVIITLQISGLGNECVYYEITNQQIKDYSFLVNSFQNDTSVNDTKDTTENQQSTDENAEGPALSDPDVYPIALFCYTETSWNWVRPVIFFLAGVFIAWILHVLAITDNYPLFKKRRPSKVSRARQKWNKKLVLCWALLNLIFVVLADYYYTYTLENQIESESARLVTNDRNASNSAIVLRDGESVSQIFKSEASNLSGIAIQILHGTTGSGKIGYRIFDRKNETLLDSGTYTLSNLNYLSDHLYYQDATYKIADLAEKSFEIPFSKNLRLEKSDYRIELTAKDMKGGFLSIAGFTTREETSKGESILREPAVLAVYKSNLFLKDFYFGIFLTLWIFLNVLYILLSLFSLPTEKVFLAGVLIIGILFSFMIPPYSAPDERAHVDTVYRMSNELLGIHDEPALYRMYKRAGDVNPKIENTMDISATQYRMLQEGLFEKSQNTELVYAFGAGNQVINVTTVHYLPLLIGFHIGRLLGFNLITMIMLGRWCSLLVTGWLMYLGIKKMPFGKSILAVIGLFPMTLQQIATFNYDGMIIAAAYLFVGYVMSLIFESKHTVSDVLITLLASCLLALSKGGVYIPLLGMLFMAHMKWKWHGKDKSISLVMIIPALMVFLSQYVNRVLTLLMGTSTTAINYTDSNKLYSISFFKDKPTELLRLIQNTVMVRADELLREIVGARLGKLNVYIPWYVVIAFLAILAGCVLSQKGRGHTLRNKQKIWVLFLCACGAGVIMLAMLFSWTPESMDFINGLQGRYFLPYMGALMIVLRGRKITWDKKPTKWLIYAALYQEVLVFGYVFLCVFYSGWG